MKNIVILGNENDTRVWADPYTRAGYHILSIREAAETSNSPVQGVLAVPRYENFTISGSQSWKLRDEIGLTKVSVDLVNEFLKKIKELNPSWWALANPVGRLKALVDIGEPVLKFNPYDFGDSYKRRAQLWGSFNMPIKTPVKIPKLSKETIKLLKKSGQLTERPTSLISQGFARAFFEANP